MISSKVVSGLTPYYFTPYYPTTYYLLLTTYYLLLTTYSYLTTFNVSCVFPLVALTT